MSGQPGRAEIETVVRDIGLRVSRENAAAQPFPCLDQGKVEPVAMKVIGCRKSGKAAADDDNGLSRYCCR
ncbi:hypothetical protein GGE67_006378 [Rhizobium leucaenae]|nr:hypothetical protein [Rhizobium leucaenae]